MMVLLEGFYLEIIWFRIVDIILSYVREVYGVIRWGGGIIKFGEEKVEG